MRLRLLGLGRWALWGRLGLGSRTLVLLLAALGLGTCGLVSIGSCSSRGAGTLGS